jgi:hypothetical protein
MTLSTDLDLSALLDCLYDVCVYEIADATAQSASGVVDAETIECLVEIIDDESPPSSASCDAQNRGALAILALREIVRARDYHAEHGIYPPGTVDRANQCFDDWAADLAEAVLGGGA